jgi:hypothetical protein
LKLKGPPQTPEGHPVDEDHSAPETKKLDFPGLLTINVNNTHRFVKSKVHLAPMITDPSTRPFLWLYSFSLGPQNRQARWYSNHLRQAQVRLFLLHSLYIIFSLSNLAALVCSTESNFHFDRGTSVGCND